MRLRKEKYISKNPVNTTTTTTTKYTKIHNIKTSNMDKNDPSQSQNIYLNKILQQNLGNDKLSQEPTNLQKNYQKFQTSIQNIFSNEESRQKAKNYVLKIRNKKGSPLSTLSRNEENKKNDLSKTNRESSKDLYNSKEKNNFEEKLDNNKSRNINYRDKMIYSKTNNINEQNPTDRYIKINKVTKYYEEIPYNSGKGNIYVRSNLEKSRNNNRGILKNAKTSNPINTNNRQNSIRNESVNYYNNYYNSKNDIYSNENININQEGYINDIYDNQFDTNSFTEHNVNNSGLREIVIDNINEIYQSPEALNRKTYDYDEELYKFSKKTEIYSSNKYPRSKSRVRKNYNISVDNNYENENIYDYRPKTNKRYYKKIRIMSSPPINRDFDEDEDNISNDIDLRKESKRKKIKLNKVDYNSEIMRKIRNKFLENLKEISTFELCILANDNANENDKQFRTRNDINKNYINEIKQIKNELETTKNKNKENENIINNLQNIINNQKKDIDSKNKEKTIMKNNYLNNELKLQKEINDLQNEYENLMKINKNINDENINVKREYGKIMDNNKRLENELKRHKNDESIGEEFNKLKEDYDNIDEEYNTLKERINIVIEENKKLKNEIILLNERNNNYDNLNKKLKYENEKLIKNIKLLKDNDTLSNKYGKELNNLINEYKKLNEEKER